jgi:hypothetical protein
MVHVSPFSSATHSPITSVGAVMVDPITIGSAAHFSLCLVKTISQLILKANGTDATVKDLGTEIQRLGTILDLVKDLENTEPENLEGPAKPHWEDISASLTECYATLESLNQIFRKVDQVKRPLFGIWRRVKWDWNSEDIQRLRYEIAIHRRGIQINLSMIMV